MLSFGFGELALIAMVLLVVVGPERLPKAMQFLGKSYGQLRRAADDLRRAFVLEADRQDAEDRFSMLKERREQARRDREAAMKANPGVVTQDEKLHIPEGAELEPEQWNALPDHVKELVQKGLESGEAAE
jgi:sec-independent protein translocase protein TatB